MPVQGAPMFALPSLGIRARLSHLNRARQITTALVRHGLGSLVDQLGFSDGALADPKAGALTSARFGRRLALTLADLGPTYVKLGQILATRDDLLPVAVTTELATLQERAPPIPASEVRAAIEAALGAPIESLFRAFEPEPLAAASIAQVHRATTLDGEPVVVKVRRPGVPRVVDDDLAMIDDLAEQIDQRIAEAKRFDPRGLATEFAAGLRRELDFRLEAQAIARMREAVGDTSHLPRVYDALSCETVLTLEYIEGRKVTSVPDRERRSELARQILRTFTRQVLRAGYFHADPHPGNLLARTGSDALALIDLGAVGEVSPDSRAVLYRIAAAAAARDVPSLSRALLSMAEQTHPIDPAAFEADVGAFLTELVARGVREIPLSEITSRVFDVMRRHDLRLRAEFFQLFRAAAMVDGVLRELDPGLDPLRAAGPHILSATVSSRDLRPAAALATALIRARWRRDAAFRAVAIAGGVGWLAAAVLLVAWLASVL